MPLGILNTSNAAPVPGTVSLAEKDRELGNDLDGNLKKIGDIILVPQPSDDCDDPLNWSAWRKNSVLLILSILSAVASALGAMISPGLTILAEQFDKSLDVISTYLVGLFILWTGIFTFFSSASASVWGKRIVFVLSTLALFLLNVWGFFTTTFEPFVAMRLLQAFASAPAETLVTSAIQDIFYVHERGQKVAVWGLMISSGILAGQIISGFIIENLGVRYTFGITALIFIPLTISLCCFVPETVYRRSPPVGAKSDEDSEHKFPLSTVQSISSDVSEDESKKASSGLAIFRGRVSDDSFWKLLLKPFPLFAYPAVIFSSVIYGSFFTWIVVLSVLSVPIFSAPPYGLSPSQIGITNVPLLFAGIAGSAISGWMSDQLVRFMARRNGGIYEPEFRLVLMVVAAVISSGAFFGFGITVEMGLPLPVPLTFASLHALAAPFATQAAYTYVTDCHPNDANQAFVSIGLVKAGMTFLASTSVNGWYEAQGPKVVFWSIAGVNLGACTLTLPMYILGKRFRALIDRKIDCKVSH